MKITRYILIALALTCFLSPLQAKPATIKGIPKDCKVHKPPYSRNFMNAELMSMFSVKGYETSDKTNEYWDVYSDRNHNETYMSSNGDTRCDELGFREPVRIARIKNGYALVYKTNGIPSTFPQIPSDIEWKGWVPLANLVVTEKVLTNELGVPISVLIKDNVDFDSQLKLKADYYSDPFGDPEDITLPNCTNSIFYPIKTAGPFVLLATETDISDPSHIYGWMKRDNLLIWKSRIAIEPTWDILDNDFLALVKHKGEIKGENDEILGTIDYIKKQEGSKFTPETHRIHSGAWRFPVIFSTADSVSCAIPAQATFLDNPSLRIPVAVNAAGDAFGAVADARDVDINILFVIDGSRLYEPFFPILAERIAMIENQDNPSNIKVGALIYHDARSGEHMTELFRLTRPDDAELRDFVDMGGQYGFKDNLSEAPLLAALDEAVDRAGFDSDAQNFIILIGGRGDSSDSDLIPSDIARKLAYANIGVYALQVQNNSGTAAYRLFGYLSEDILRQSVESKLETSVSIKCETNADYSFISYYADNANDTDVFDSYQSVRDGLMSENDFDLNLERILQRVNRSVDNSVGHSASLSSMYPQFFVPGKMESSWSSRKTVKEVALFSSADFDRLLDLFKRLNELYLFSSTDREAFFYILMEYLPPFLMVENSYYPYNKMNQPTLAASIKKMGLYQLFSLIEGIPNNAFLGHYIKDVLSLKDVSNEEYLYILSDISRRYYRLMTIRNNPALYSTYINNQSYFWIPCEDLL